MHNAASERPAESASGVASAAATGTGAAGMRTWLSAGSGPQLACLRTIHSGIPHQARKQAAASGMFSQNQNIVTPLVRSLRPAAAGRRVPLIRLRWPEPGPATAASVAVGAPAVSHAADRPADLGGGMLAAPRHERVAGTRQNSLPSGSRITTHVLRDELE
jgi:hypothetical protein